MPSKRPTAVFLIDASISIGFGAASWLSPFATYGSIVDIEGLQPHGLALSALATISALYVVIGAVCACAAFMPQPYGAWLAAVMMLRHGWVGAKGFAEVGRSWLIGNPWTDIVIHAVFVVAYGALIVRSREALSKKALRSPAAESTG